MRAEGYDIRALDLQVHNIVPPQTGESEAESEDPNEVSPTLIVVAGPQKNLLPDEEEALNQYLRDGGRMLMLMDPETPASFREFLAKWGLKLGSGNIIDQENFIGEHRTPFISQHNPNYPFTQNLGRTFFPGVASLEPSFERIPEAEYGDVTPPTDQECIGQWAVGGLQGMQICYQLPTFDWNEQVFPLMNPEALAITSSGSWLIEEPGRTEPREDEDRAGPFIPMVYVNAYGPIGEEIVQSEEGSGPRFPDSGGRLRLRQQRAFQQRRQRRAVPKFVELPGGGRFSHQHSTQAHNTSGIVGHTQRVQRHSLHELVPASGPDGHCGNARMVGAPVTPDRS